MALRISDQEDPIRRDSAAYLCFASMGLRTCKINAVVPSHDIAEDIELFESLSFSESLLTLFVHRKSEQLSLACTVVHTVR